MELTLILKPPVQSHGNQKSPLRSVEEIPNVSTACVPAPALRGASGFPREEEGVRSHERASRWKASQQGEGDAVTTVHISRRWLCTEASTLGFLVLLFSAAACVPRSPAVAAGAWHRDEAVPRFTKWCPNVAGARLCLLGGAHGFCDGVDSIPRPALGENKGRVTSTDWPSYSSLGGPGGG